MDNSKLIKKILSKYKNTDFIISIPIVYGKGEDIVREKIQVRSSGNQNGQRKTSL